MARTRVGPVDPRRLAALGLACALAGCMSPRPSRVPGTDRVEPQRGRGWIRDTLATRCGGTPSTAGRDRRGCPGESRDTVLDPAKGIPAATPRVP